MERINRQSYVQKFIYMLFCPFNNIFRRLNVQVFGHYVKGEGMPLPQLPLPTQCSYIVEVGGESTYTNRMQFTPVGIFGIHVHM